MGNHNIYFNYSNFHVNDIEGLSHQIKKLTNNFWNTVCSAMEWGTGESPIPKIINTKLKMGIPKTNLGVP